MAMGLEVDSVKWKVVGALQGWTYPAGAGRWHASGTPSDTGTCASNASVISNMAGKQQLALLLLQLGCPLEWMCRS